MKYYFSVSEIHVCGRTYHCIQCSPCGPKKSSKFDPVSSLVSRFLPLFSVCFPKLSDLFESPSKLALEMSILLKFELIFELFKTKIFLPRSAKHFQSGFKLELVRRVLANFSRQAGPLFAGAPAHAAMCLACDTNVALPLHCVCFC